MSLELVWPMWPRRGAKNTNLAHAMHGSAQWHMPACHRNAQSGDIRDIQAHLRNSEMVRIERTTLSTDVLQRLRRLMLYTASPITALLTSTQGPLRRARGARLDLAAPGDGRRRRDAFA
eukprot:2912011-Prymnesium_polylepis.2